MAVYVDKLFGLFGRRASAARASGDSTSNSGTTTGGSIDQEPVVVWDAANSLEAQIIIGRLESEGIPAIMQGEALGTIYGLTSGGLAKTAVLVPAPLAEKATSILESEYLVEIDDENFSEEQDS